MDQGSVIGHISGTFDGLLVMEASGDTFFIVDPERNLPDNRKMPFATVVTGDRYDDVSDLDRDEATFRLNIGLTKAGYTALFPTPPEGVDQTAVDVVLPHPIYAGQYWVGIVNPSDTTFRTTVEPMLVEAYEFAVRKHRNHAGRVAR